MNFILKPLSKYIYLTFKALPFIANRLVGRLCKVQMICCGNNVTISPLSSDIKGWNNIHIGNNVLIPKGAIIYSLNATLAIKDNVIFGPRPIIITGDHRIDEIGVPIISSHNKIDKNDQDVTIEEDVWTGANITILKGVTIGRGSVIAAGAVVNKSVPPYSIVGGVPAKVLKNRFTLKQALKHEEALYPPEKRYSRDQLSNLH